jgi:ribosomal protein S18 acetylase RimI-like enzyme
MERIARRVHARPMTGADELYDRGARTLLASWELYAHGLAGASLRRLPGVAAAVFPRGPERAIYNNALLERGLPGASCAAAVDAMERAYAAAGVGRFAAWVHESDGPMRAELEGRGYALAETTRAMGMDLEGIRVPRPELELGPPDWGDYLATFGLPPDLLAAADLSGFHLTIVRSGGRSVAAALALDHDGDCGIYNVGTIEAARRRGLATALTALGLHEARARGCRTASLQAAAAAEGVYAAAGFRDLGRILEYGPRGEAG